jgi:hypothetical protein
VKSEYKETLATIKAPRELIEQTKQLLKEELKKETKKTKGAELEKTK